MSTAQSDFGYMRARTTDFVAEVWEHHRVHRRDLPWRRTHDPYEILVSEVMLQQTQVARVLEKYPRFLAAFPTVQALAQAEVADVLASWQGLGYNRRALNLHRAATAIVADHAGHVPDDPERLRRLPGIGAATAAALCAFAFGRAEPFVETNIRSAFIHFFFPGRDNVADVEILPLVAETMDREHPREWFYALMDYGVWIKAAHGNPSRRSRHHGAQSSFSGSRRELRAQVLRVLLAAAPTPVDLETVRVSLPDPTRDPQEVRSVLDDLTREGFLERVGSGHRIAMTPSGSRAAGPMP